MIIQVCIGSSCHLKGSKEIVEMMESAISERSLESEVTLAGSFCIGKCSPVGITIQIDDDVFTGVTKEDFKDFFEANVVRKIEAERS